MAASAPAGLNTFVPTFEATGAVIGFTRDPKKFKINDYWQIIPKKKSEGYYMRLDSGAAARVGSPDKWIWPDGADAPTNEDNTFPFVFMPYKTTRRHYGFRIGDKAVDNADWNVVQHYAKAVSMQAMLVRTWLAAQALQDTANWDGNTATASTLGAGAGLWNGSNNTPGDANYLNIKKTINAALIAINKATNGIVTAPDLRLLLGPEVATAISQSAELQDALKQSQYAKDMIQGSRNEAYGLPNQLYGLEVIVEDASHVTSKKGASSETRQFFWTGSHVAILSRIGGLEGPAEGPSYSTLQGMVVEEFTTETKNDPDNRRTVGRVIDDYDIKVAAPGAGYLIRNVLA
jgi:hypothetical protein